MLAKISIGHFLLVAVAMLVPGCAHLQAYRGWTLAPEAKQPTSMFRNYRSGHLLQHGAGVVLEVNKFYPGNLIVMDDERCVRAWVEVPAGVELESKEIAAPRAFLQRCNCTWGQCTEEISTGGVVKLTSTKGDVIRASLSLRFPSTHVRANGRFQVCAPQWTALWDDAESAQQKEALERGTQPCEMDKIAGEGNQ